VTPRNADILEVAVAVTGVGVRYDLRITHQRTLRRALGELIHGRPDEPPFWALRNVTFAVRAGETVGVIGKNGAGKSTLLLVLAGILRPDEGSVRTFGRTSTLLTLGAGFDGELTGRENVFLAGAFLGLSRAQLEQGFDEIVDFAELGAFIDVPLRKYSNGMRARLGFAIAAHVEPDVLLLDEVLGVGDASFQRKSTAKLHEMMDSAKAIVVVSHQMPFVQETCSKVLWLHEGRVAAWGEPSEVIGRYLSAAEQPQHAVRTVG
jgi:ABC-type polysaccharide/polyol phosphate transport system ATPase subunit